MSDKSTLTHDRLTALHNRSTGYNVTPHAMAWLFKIAHSGGKELLPTLCK
jgi:hypothetical protein